MIGSHIYPTGIADATMVAQNVEIVAFVEV